VAHGVLSVSCQLLLRTFLVAPLNCQFSSLSFLLKNQMRLTLKNCGAADRLHDTQKESSQQKSRLTHVFVYMHVRAITSIYGGEQLDADKFISETGRLADQ
jgi:hypothetical protein